MRSKIDRTKRDTYMCKKLCNMFERRELRDDHPQQRRAGQWTAEDRDNFMVTVLLNEDFDPIRLCEQVKDDGIKVWLIDGLQKMTYIKNFKAGKFKLGNKIDPSIAEWQEVVVNEDGEEELKDIEYDLRGKGYLDLPERLREDFDNCPINVVKHLDCSDKEVGRHIIRYNAGKQMVAAQKISAYMYNTAKYVKEISGHAFFNDCANYSDTADRNGTIDRVVCESMMGLNFFDVWNKDAKKMGKYINDNATEEMFEEFKHYLDRLLDVITPETGKLFSLKHACIFFMLFKKFTKLGQSDEEFESFLENFEELKNQKVKIENEYELEKGSGVFTNSLSFYEFDEKKNTKEKKIIEDKLLILETLMNEFLHINNEEVAEDMVEQTEVCDDIVEEPSVEQFVAECVELDVADIKDEMDFYNQSLDDLLEVIEDDNSKLLHEGNRPSLLAMMVYSYKEDKDLEDWMKDYSENNNTYFVDQRKNYLHMLKDLESYLNKKGEAA